MKIVKQRQSNIELLRIFAALGVILLHYNNPNLGGGFSFVPKGSLNQIIMIFLEVLFICAVNLYVLISGYFMRNSMKRNFIKPLQLLGQLIVFEILFFLIKEVATGVPFSFKNLLNYFTPSYWFIFVYIALYFISLYINHLWNNINDKQRKNLLLICIGLFSIYPIITEIIQYYTQSIDGISTVSIVGSIAGYSIINFMLIYLIGCYLKDRKKDIDKISIKKLIMFLVVNVVILMGWTYIDHKLTGKALNLTPAWNYENPLVISEAVLIFLIFKKIKIRNNKIINKLALASFPSYLIHLNLLSCFCIDKFVVRNPLILLLHIFVTTVIIYIISFILYLLYDYLTKPIFNKLSKKIKNEITIS